MRALPPMLLAGLLASAAHAQEATPPPRTPRPAPRKPPPPLSKEDAELVKQLALLEHFELVKNLELFEAEPDGGDPPPPQRQP